MSADFFLNFKSRHYIYKRCRLWTKNITHLHFFFNLVPQNNPTEENDIICFLLIDLFPPVPIYKRCLLTVFLTTALRLLKHI
jgi:hypothetical protein